MTVYKLVLQDPGTQVQLYDTSTAKTRGAVTSDNYYFTDGIEIIDADDGHVEGAYVGGTGGSRPTVRVTSGSQEIVDQDLVGPENPLGWFKYSAGGVEPGVSYVVAFGFGSGTYRVGLSLVTSAGTCTLITPSAVDAIHLDQTDFASHGQDLRTSGQAYAFAAGGGGGLTASFATSRTYFAGYFAAGVLGADRGVGDLRLDYNTPAGSGFIRNNGDVEIGWKRPTTSQGTSASFALTYKGLDPVVLIDGYALDLP